MHDVSTPLKKTIHNFTKITCTVSSTTATISFSRYGTYVAQRIERSALRCDEVQEVEQHVTQLGADAAVGEERQVVVVRADQSVAPSKRRGCLVVLVGNAVVPYRKLYLGIQASNGGMQGEGRARGGSWAFKQVMEA